MLDAKPDKYLLTKLNESGHISMIENADRLGTFIEK